MALVKDTLRQNIYDGLYDIFTAQALNATEGDEQENPDVIIKRLLEIWQLLLQMPWIRSLSRVIFLLALLMYK